VVVSGGTTHGLCGLGMQFRGGEGAFGGDVGEAQQSVLSPLLSNIVLHEVDRQWCRSDGTISNAVVLVRYADDMVLLARTEPQARQAWERLQNQFAALRLVVNQEKSRLTTVGEGFAFLGFEFRKLPIRLLYMWPRKKACQHIRYRVREVVRSFPSSASIGEVIRKLNPTLNGWLLPGRQQQPDLS
jgi:RNA-directed DNA polymerase